MFCTCKHCSMVGSSLGLAGTADMPVQDVNSCINLTLMNHRSENCAMTDETLADSSLQEEMEMCTLLAFQAFHNFHFYD